jgi:hypothetical protein
MPSATLLLPPRARFAGEALPPALGKALGRADGYAGPPGPASLFEVLPRGWPAAAVTRQVERGDASGAQWVRADPAYVRPDINGARLLAIGGVLGLDEASAESLLRALRPVFGDFGMPIEATSPSRWYLRVDPGAPLPRFADPDDALGADLFDHLPPGDVGRRWRALLSDAQVTLHQHPLNAERAASGLAPINSVWFWGAGRLPDHVRTPLGDIASDDEVVAAFAAIAGARHGPVPARWPGPGEGAAAYDLRRSRRLDALCAEWLEPAAADLRRGVLASLDLAFDDGSRFAMRRSQSLRFWRRPLRALIERDAQ